MRSLKSRVGRYVKLRFFKVPDPIDDFCAVCQRLGVSTILDIGAHKGEVVARVAPMFPNAQIHCFEPTPETFAHLKARFSEEKRIHCHSLAASDQSGKAVFQLSQNEQANSLLDSIENPPDQVQGAMTPAGSVEVTTICLDEWAAKRNLAGPIAAKIDIQGAELRMLQGGETLFRDQLDFVVCEANLAPMYRDQSDLFSLHRALVDLNFELFNIYRTVTSATGQALWTDATWIKPAALAKLKAIAR